MPADVSTTIEVAKFTDPDPVINGLSFSATVTVNGSSQAGTIVEKGNGDYGIEATLTGVNALVSISLEQNESPVAEIEAFEQAQPMNFDTITVKNAGTPGFGADEKVPLGPALNLPITQGQGKIS